MQHRGDVDGAADNVSARVHIMSDVRLLREGVQLCLLSRHDLLVSGSSDVSLAAAADIDPLIVDAVLVDVGATEALEIIRTLAGRRVRVIGFAMRDQDNDILKGVEAGLAGYVTSNGGSDELVACLAAAMRGESACSPRIASLLFERVAALSLGHEDKTRRALTARESEVARLLGLGYSNKEIARTLRIGAATVKNHVHHILEKLGVRRRGEAVARLHGRGRGGAHPVTTS